MSVIEPSEPTRTTRPKNLDPLELGLKLPVAGIVSLLHRASGVILFLAIPLAIYLLDVSLSGEEGFADFSRTMSNPLIKLLAFGITWALFHHLCAGIRFLALDMHLGVDKPYHRLTAIATLVVSIFFTLIVGVLLW